MAAFGFRPVRYTNGAPWNGATVRCSILASNSTAAFVGDTVILAGTSSTSPVDGAILNDVTFCAAGNRTYGVITAVLPNVSTSQSLNQIYGSASTYREVLVAVAEPNLIFEGTADEGLVVTGASAAQGVMYDIAAGAGSTTTGRSGHVADASVNSTTSASWMLVGVRNDPENLATVGSVTASTAVASTASQPTILEFVCAEPQVFITQLGAGV